MVMLRACPRCITGSVTRGGDSYGLYIQCLQCGYLKDVDDEQTDEDGSSKAVASLVTAQLHEPWAPSEAAMAG